MMQFLRSTLFPRSIGKISKAQNKDTLISLLEKRVTLLEEENKRAEAAVQELTSCIKSMSYVLADLASEVSVHAAYLQGSTTRSSYEDDILTRYLKDSDDDDDGYLN